MMDADKARKIYWGAGPLPKGATCIGECATAGRKGALIRLANGNIVQGNAGSIRTIPTQ